MSTRAFPPRQRHQLPGRRLGKRTLRETCEKDGKVTFTSTMTVAADGKTMKSSNHNQKTGNTSTWDSEKQ